MRQVSVMFLAALAAICVVAVTTAGEPVKIERKALERMEVTGSGEQLYAQLCASCHGVDGTGDGPAAPALAVPVPDLTALAAGNDGEFPGAMVRDAISGERRVVAHGSVEMPVWGTVLAELRPDWKLARREAFAEQRIARLTAYLESLQRS